MDLRAPLVISDAGFLNTFDRLLPKEISEKTRTDILHFHYFTALVSSFSDALQINHCYYYY